MSTPDDTKVSERVAGRYKEKKETDKGNTVYLYSDRQISRRNNEKAKRLEKLRKNVHKVRDQVKQDLASGDPEKVLTALAVGLMDHTAERVGNSESAKEGHFGVTGWTSDHVKFSNGKATISYVGKSGVKQKKTVKDKALVKALKDAVEACEDGSIFCHETATINASKVNKYLKKFDITAKDLRGLHANQKMQEKLKSVRKGKLPEDPKEREKQLKEEFKKALEETAEDVGHEASTLKNQYLVPDLEEEYMKGRVMDKMVKTAENIALASRVVARAIRLHKDSIRSLAKDLESVIASKGRNSPMGKRVLVQEPFTVQAVDGSLVSVTVVVATKPSEGNPELVIEGGLGTYRGQKVVLVYLNGSKEGLKTWAQKKLLWQKLYPVLIHELSHVADKYTKGVGDRMTQEEAQGNEAYYNDPGEVRAYMQEVVDEASERFRHWDKLVSIAPTKAKAVDYLLGSSGTWAEVSPYWTTQNKQKVLKAVVQALEEYLERSP